MTPTRTAWLFVAAQFVLLAALWRTPVDDLWSRPGWLLGAASVAFWLGLSYAAMGALWLRGSLTALPLPRRGGALCSTGPYRWSRHPIYFGALVACGAMTVRRASVSAVALFALLVVFFNVKARWEEPHLADQYPGYGDYARRTGRIVPRLR